MSLLKPLMAADGHRQGEHANTTQKVLLAQPTSNQETSAEVTVTHTRDPLNLTINF